MKGPENWTLTETADALRARRISSVELTQALLARIDTWQPKLNAFVTIEPEAALAAARRADDDIDLARGIGGGPLHGVPLAHKDMYYYAGKVAGCGSKVRRDFVPDTTATVISRLQAAGSFRLGTLHMAEFAYGPTGHNAHHGPARNPWNPQHITGGSSSGSGAAVAARLVHAALGSDTGGSIRGPAHFCGVTGLKTSYGRVSRASAMPLSFTLDTVGPLAQTAEDCGLITSIIAGPDPRDPVTAGVPAWDADLAARSARAFTIGIPDSYYVDDLEPSVAKALDAAIETFRKLGATIVKVTLPDQTLVSAAAMVIISVEATSYHAPSLRTRPQDFGPQVRARLENGLAYSAVEYLEALRWRGPALAAHLAALGKIDAVLAPVCRSPAYTIAETDTDAGAEADAIVGSVTRMMRPVNFLGLPSISVPAGFSEKGLPIGMQLIGRPFRDEALVALGTAFQSATDYHRKIPALP